MSLISKSARVLANHKLTNRVSGCEQHADYSIEKDLQKMLALEYHIPVTPAGKYAYYPVTLPVPERSIANTHAVSYKIVRRISSFNSPNCSPSHP